MVRAGYKFRRVISVAAAGWQGIKRVDCFLADLPICHSDTGKHPFFASLARCLWVYPFLGLAVMFCIERSAGGVTCRPQGITVG